MAPEKFGKSKFNLYRKFKSDDRKWELIKILHPPPWSSIPLAGDRLAEISRMTDTITDPWSEKGFDTAISDQEDDKRLVYVSLTNNRSGVKPHTYIAKRYGRKGTFLKWNSISPNSGGSSKIKDNIPFVVGGVLGAILLAWLAAR